MNAIATSYAAASTALSTVLDAVPADAWSRPSPCEGWTAQRVVQHIVDAQRDLLATHGCDLGPPPDLADPAAGFAQHAARVLDQVTEDSLADRPYDGFFGPTTLGATLEQFYVWDMVVHRWDIARATGGDETLTADELARVEAGADFFGEAMYTATVCAPALPAPAGADRQTALLARLGRRA